MKFEGKTVIITGGASGIGAALAERATEAGARVCVADLDLAGAQAVAGRINGLSVACDVTDETQITQAIAQTEAAFGDVDIFVSNAGFGRGDPDHAASAPDAEWMQSWQVHVMAHVYAARALLPKMIARGSGHLVNVASAAGLLNQIGDAAYTATKHAAVSFAESLAISHGDDGVGVSVVCPQYVATPLLGLSDLDADQSNSLLTADQVAQTIVMGVEADEFMILPHSQVAGYYELRAQDSTRWIKGMQLLRAKAKAEYPGLNVQDFYKLV
ncbi:short-chain dehydrogenase [Sulfitobacter sp. SK012]|uniref:SDR family oxidoreductase n=1 Tax=Sulfitobacter sp. SK012 TaxID=1389005 RepID=UPI000E0A075A|nr:SDR family oxidoreductase [Sulfitobacter sp. SK012]AXI44637.1 short-chain dehydrogenase [Sulfitobacter sp. SK012]